MRYKDYRFIYDFESDSEGVFFSFVFGYIFVCIRVISRSF